MSYARFGWDGSDVYVYQSSEGYECCGCAMFGHWRGESPEQMILHLREHQSKGHHVPDDTFAVLEEETPNNPPRAT